MKKVKQIKIAVTGPESSGKTTLCKLLATELQGIVVPESARIYLRKNGKNYGKNDVYKMLEAQLNSEDKAVAENQLIICDTEAINYKIWLKEKYQIENNKVDSIIANRPYDLFLLCYPDLPWVQDPLREFSDLRIRQYLFEQFEFWLIHYKKTYGIVKGNAANRFKVAMDIVNKNIDFSG